MKGKKIIYNESAYFIGLIVLVQIFQTVGGHLATRLDKRLRNRS